jgi:hypothetical protein
MAVACISTRKTNTSTTTSNHIQCDMLFGRVLGGKIHHRFNDIYSTYRLRYNDRQWTYHCCLSWCQCLLYSNYLIACMMYASRYSASHVHSQLALPLLSWRLPGDAEKHTDVKNDALLDIFGLVARHCDYWNGFRTLFFYWVIATLIEKVSKDWLKRSTFENIL